MCCKGDTIWLAFNRKDGMPLEVFKGSSEIRRNIDSWEHRKSLELPKELELEEEEQENELRGKGEREMDG